MTWRIQILGRQRVAFALMMHRRARSETEDAFRRNQRSPVPVGQRHEHDSDDDGQRGSDWREPTMSPQRPTRLDFHCVLPLPPRKFPHCCLALIGARTTDLETKVTLSVAIGGQIVDDARSAR